MSIHTSLVRAGLCVLLAVPVAAEAPRGSITIDPHLADQISVCARVVARREDGGLCVGCLGQQDLFVVETR